MVILHNANNKRKSKIFDLPIFNRHTSMTVLLLFGDIANAGSVLRLHSDTQHTDRPKYLYTKCTPPHFLR